MEEMKMQPGVTWCEMCRHFQEKQDWKDRALKAEARLNTWDDEEAQALQLVRSLVDIEDLPEPSITRRLILKSMSDLITRVRGGTNVG